MVISSVEHKLAEHKLTKLIKYQDSLSLEKCLTSKGWIIFILRNSKLIGGPNKGI